MSLLGFVSIIPVAGRTGSVAAVSVGIPMRAMVAVVWFAIGFAHPVGTRHFGIRIANAGQIRDTRRGIEVIEHHVSAVAIAFAGDAAVRIGDVTEDERVAGTSLLAGGL